MLNTKHSKGFFIRLISGITLAIVAIVTTLSVMLPSHAEWKKYYDNVMAEKKQKEYLNSLPLKFLGISAELNQGVKYYDNESAYPEKGDFTVKANFTEKWKDFTKKLSSKEYTMTVPEDFAKNGGTIVFSYSYQPEDTKNDKGETVTPDPVEKTTELKVTLIEPDETVFKVIKEPTFTEAGYAENNKGVKKNLPAFNLNDYTFDNLASSKLVKITHNDSGLVIRKAITDEITVYNSEKKSFFYNNIDCHYASDIENLKISFEDGTFVLGAKDGTNVSLGKILAEKSIVAIGSGVVNIEEGFSVSKFIVNKGATVNIDSTISVTDMLVQEGGTLNITASGDTVKVADDGVLEWYGTVNITSKTKGKATAICLWNNASIKVSSDSRVTVTDYEYALGKWVDNGTKEDGTPVGRKGNLYIPSTSAISGKYVKKDEINLIDASTCTNFYSTWSINLIKVTEGYSVITKPTPTSEGLASDPKKGDYVLPKLNFTDYEVGIGGSTLTFVHDVTGVIIELPITENANLKIDGVAIDYASATGYKFTVDEGKTAELTGNISGTSITISGKGTLSLTGSVTVTKLLLVESGATFNATGVNSDTVNIIGDAVARLYGTVVIKSVAGKTGIKLEKATSALYLSSTSRVSVSGGDFTIGHYNSSAKVYYPAGATVGGNKITAANGDVLLSYGAVCRIEFVAES